MLRPSRRTNPCAKGLPALGVSYLRGERTSALQIGELAVAVAAVIHAGADATERYVRAVTMGGERTLTDRELLRLLITMSEIRARDDD